MSCAVSVQELSIFYVSYPLSILHNPLSIKERNEIKFEKPDCVLRSGDNVTNINTDRIVEICYLKVYPNGNEETKTMRINPEMHIPEASSAVHGIYDADVADCPTFKEVARMWPVTLKAAIWQDSTLIASIFRYWQRNFFVPV